MAGCAGGGADGNETVEEGEQSGRGSGGEIDVSLWLEALGCRREGQGAVPEAGTSKEQVGQGTLVDSLSLAPEPLA